MVYDDVITLKRLESTEYTEKYSALLPLSLQQTTKKKSYNFCCITKNKEQICTDTFFDWKWILYFDLRHLITYMVPSNVS